MRVLIVSRASYRLPASQGGTDAYALRTARYLVPQGHEVFLVGQGQPGPAFGSIGFIRVPTNVQASGRFRLTYFLKGLVLSLGSVLSAIKFLRRRESHIDVIHSNSHLGVLILKRLFPSYPLVYTIHDPLYRPGSRLAPLERLIRPINNGLLERWALRRADSIIAVSSEIRSQVERMIGSAEKLSLLYPFSRPATIREESRSHASIPLAPQPYVLSVGAQMGRKRFDLLIRALVHTRPPVNLVLVGTGSDRPRLIRTAQEFGVAERVYFYDHVSEASIGELYRGATVYAMASAREGFPVTLIEAALSGTPTLYFTESSTEDLEGFQSDFFRVIRSLDDSEIANAINSTCSRVLGDSVPRHEIEGWARSRFQTPEAVANDLGKIYADVADGKL